MQDEFNFDKYPHKAGHRGVRTSISAAEDINKHLSRIKKMVLLELSKVYPKGLTGTEIADKTKRSILSIRPRTTELKILGLIIDTEETKKNDAGKPEIIYKLRNLDVIDDYGLSKD